MISKKELQALDRQLQKKGAITFFAWPTMIGFRDFEPYEYDCYVYFDVKTGEKVGEYNNIQGKETGEKLFEIDLATGVETGGKGKEILFIVAGEVEENIEKLLKDFPFKKFDGEVQDYYILRGPWDFSPEEYYETLWEEE